jgi:hypothetical protein
MADIILPTGVICASVKTALQAVFLRRNGLQNRFTENPESTDYDGGKNIEVFFTL